MGSCTRRHFMLSTCLLQMITIIERQVFDFLGYMWAPILVNFFHIIFIILGFYGAYHFRIKYIITYLIWSFIWIGWNAFLICFYLNVGILDRDSDLLNLGTGSVSWFEVNGYGCKPTYPVNITSDDPFRPIRPERVDDCLLDYTIVEIVQSGVQCALALLGILGAILISYIFLDEDDRLRHVNKKSKHRQSLYSIEFGPSIDTIRSRADTILDYDDHLHGRDDGGELSPKPMTPRRVKRRSVMARGTNSRQSTTSRRSHHGRGERGEGGTHGSSSSGGGTHPRNSTRSSRRKYQQNPVTKLLDQQQLQLQQQQQQQHLHHHHPHGGHHGQPKQQLGSFQHKEIPAPLTASNLQTLNQEIINNTSGSTVVSAAAADAGGTLNNILLSGGSLTKTNNNHYHSFRKNIPPDPIYYNTNAQTGLYQQTWQSNSQSPIVGDEPPPTPTLTPTLAGHFNPTYQHSTTNLNDVEHVDELYNNRPPSVRSSYSNFHGTRPLSSYLSNSAATENVFAGLTGATQSPTAGTQQAQQQQQQSQHLPTLPPLPPHVAPATPPLYQTNPLHQHPHVAGQQHIPPLPSPNFPSTPPQNIPFGKRTASRESIRSMAFLNSGPPAYNLNYHTPPDSETTM
ncbi:sodium/potassium-transporting ATPase subunit beta-1-interacting protein isoform X2 [Bactrocera neohumeralis]|uniref:sodium/potassium-transporting ATPase subunit beta-1-interacting protein isoform X2 n=1 Tax=Bactrocera neohumeralis TaxID=98809 RepID=UPI002166261D|nr:sodium/potassium-transporting ATPase subunit beta-1-interacting protein isoform X2 [Bactrocera neohumeralis]